VIPPGGEGEIKVTLRPKGGHTEITKNVVVLSNDPEQPRFSLTMKGTLLIDMVAQPPMVSIVNLAPGEPGTNSFSVQRSPGSTATVKSVRLADTEHFSIREIDTEAESLATYEVRFAGREDVGTSSTSVVVETTGEHTPQLNIPVRATAAYNLIYAKRVVLVRGADGRFERNIRISTRRGDAPEIGKIEDPDGLLDIEVLESAGPSVDIRVRVPDGDTVKIDDKAVHELRVHTNDPDEPKLELTYELRAARIKPSQVRAKGR
jgi:hypothetical protein